MPECSHKLPIWQLRTSTGAAHPMLRFGRNRCSHNMDFQEDTKEFAVSVHTNDIHEAIARTGGALYDLLEQAVMRADEDDESEFIQFATEVRNLLAVHSSELSAEEPWRDADEEAESHWSSE